MLLRLEHKQFPTMRIALATLALAFVALTNASAGRLDIAVIQFPEEKTAEMIEQAFASSEGLYEVTNADRTVTQEPYLKGGYVTVAQSIPISPGGAVSYSSRVNNVRADVEAKLGKGNVSFNIEVTEGIKAGLRSIESHNYSASGPLNGSNATVLSIRAMKAKAPLVTKGQAEMKVFGFTVVTIAQYVP